MPNWRSCCRRKLLRVLNAGEAINALERPIHTGRVAGYQAKRDGEVQAAVRKKDIRIP